MKVVFVTFANKGWRPQTTPLKRIKEEALHYGVFDKVYAFNEDDIDEEYKTMYADRLNGKGWGYWQWKSYFIKKVYSTLEDDDILFWCDAGCHLNPHGKKRMKEYLRMLSDSDKALLCFLQGLEERVWTKGDFFKHFNIDYNTCDWLQYCAGCEYIKKGNVGGGHS